MTYLNDRVLDEGLSALQAEGEQLHICSSEPATFAAVAGVSLGTSGSMSVGAPANASPNGRKVTVAAVTNGTVNADGTATHYAIVDNTNSRLLVANTLDESQEVYDGNPFTTAAIDVRIADATSAA